MSERTYTIYTTPKGRRVLKKLPKAVRVHLVRKLQVLKTNPSKKGERLEGELRCVPSFHTRYKGTEYRVIYEVHEPYCTVTVHYAASRENFYRQLPLRS